MTPLPQQFLDQMRALLPGDEYNRFVEAMAEPPRVSIRRNLHKSRGFASRPELVPWCPLGAYLDEREAFTFHPQFHGGAFYVQDASSMIIHAAIKSLALDSPVRYLDLCAAPGGKTTTAIDALPDRSLVVANEIVGTRAQVLRENIIKWGATGCVVTCNDSRALGALTHFFDIIATDVPCSGEGMMRKDEEAVAQWTPALVEQCAARQREILTAVWDALKPGGVLLYSTCTFNRQENEEMMLWLMENYGTTPIDLKFPEEWGIRHGIDVDFPCYRFMPHTTRGEGLFLCAMRKPDGISTPRRGKPARSNAKIAAETQALIKPGNYLWSSDKGVITAIPADQSAEIALLRDNLRVIYTATEVAQEKGRDIVPAHSLAMSQICSNAIPRVEIDYNTAIAYLGGESITLNDAPRGYVAVAYQGGVLGLVKNLGNRANNLYPKEWRIRSRHLPDSIKQIIATAD